jgi:signal peptidase I
MRTPIRFLVRSNSRGRADAALRYIFLLLVVAWATRCWLWMPALIIGESMVPALRPGHLAGFNKTAYWFHAPQRGDIVFIRTGKQLFIKRVIALPGEVVAVTNGSVYIDGRQLPEPYVAIADHSNIAPGRIPLGRFVVAGDNRPYSMFILVRRDRIVGRQGKGPTIGNL